MNTDEYIRHHKTLLAVLLLLLLLLCTHGPQESPNVLLHFKVPRLESPSRAAKLLDRAEEFLRQSMQLDNKRLKAVLHLRCKLPVQYHGAAVPEPRQLTDTSYFLT